MNSAHAVVRRSPIRHLLMVIHWRSVRQDPFANNSWVVRSSADFFALFVVYRILLERRSPGLEDALANIRMLGVCSLVEASPAVITLDKPVWQHDADSLRLLIIISFLSQLFTPSYANVLQQVFRANTTLGPVSVQIGHQPCSWIKH